MKAQQFTLPDQDGKDHTLDDYVGSWVVLYFYPKDDTPGCTKEACGFRDNMSMLQKNNIVVLGVSKDSVKSHKKFADKFNLPFPLLSDESTQTIHAYDSWGKKKFMGREYEGVLRNTYLINPDGEVVKKYENVKPDRHAQEIIADVQGMSS
jgi:peroxiredoxin Q/BCP